MSKKSIYNLDWSVPLDGVNYTWVLPQCVAALADKVVLVKVGGTYSFTQTLLRFVTALRDDGGDVRWWKGLWNYLTISPRGEILGSSKQTGEAVRWSAPVPLILSAFKEFRGVGYEAWDWTDPGVTHWLDKDLLDLVQFRGSEVAWTAEELVGFRNSSSTVKSGRRAGAVKNPAQITALTGLTDQGFKSLPRLAKLLLTQTWCYHPSVRTDLMILDLHNYDLTPPPLVSSEVLHQPQINTNNPSPWNL
jgi:hypothetical protein